jgi:predicted PurR-regulated permease PerM
MKNSPLITVLMVTAGVLTAVVLFLAIVFEYHFRQLRNLQPQIVNAQNNQNFVNALANDALEYSKHNPSIDPILQTVGVKAGKAAPASAGKPVGK